MDQQYQFQPVPVHTPKRRLKFILIGTGIVLASALVTVLLIKLFYKAPASAPKKDVSAAELIKKYKADYKLDGYSISTSVGDSIITYKLSDTPYTVQVSSMDNIQFAKADNSTIDDITNAASKAKSYMTDSGLTAIPGQSTIDQDRVFYDNQTTVCKAYTMFDQSKKASSYGLVCADKKLLTTERDAIKTLLALDTKSEETGNLKDVVRTTYTEGNKSLSLLSINSQDAAKVPYTLIFAAIDGKWAYVGNRTTPSIDIADSFKIPSALQNVINDPKYGGFLAKYIH
jgi:hypothetical protein